MAAYTFFSIKTYRAGIYDVVIHEMIQQYEQWYRNKNHMPAHPTAKHEIYDSWESIPTEIRKYFPHKPNASELLTNFYMLIGELHLHVYVYCHFDEKYTNKGYFIISYFNVDHGIQEIHFSNLITRVSVISVIFILLTSTLAWYSSRKIINSTSQLAEWSSDVSAPKPKQQYTELDQIANNLLKSHHKIQASNKRESKFLQQLSHELRTPIAVLTASLQLLEKRGILNNPDLSQPFQRAVRSSKNMKDLTESLLWLARRNTANLNPEEINIVTICKTLIQDNEYLLINKDLTIQLHQASKTTHSVLPSTLVKISLNNLIRNAIQHAYAGSIRIRVSNHYFIIKNRIMSDRDDTRGFGIGLDLVREICKAQGWRFELKQSAKTVTASICWPPIS